MHVNPAKHIIFSDDQLLNSPFPTRFSYTSLSAYISSRLSRDITQREYPNVQGSPCSASWLRTPKGYDVVEYAIISSILGSNLNLKFSELESLEKALNGLIEDHWQYFLVMDGNFSSVTSIDGGADLSPAQLSFYSNFNTVTHEYSEVLAEVLKSV